MEKDNNLYVQFLDEDLRKNTYPPSILVRVVFLNYLRMFFFGRREGDYKYHSDEKLTEIKVQDALIKNPDVKSLKPTIVVMRGQVQPINSGMTNNLNAFRLPDTSSSHVDQLVIPMAFQCIGKSVYESEYIASLVFGMLRYYREDIRIKGFTAIKQFVLNQVQPSPYYPQEAEIIAFQTDVTCTAYLPDRWVVRENTNKDYEEYEERTGIDAREIGAPPETLDSISTDIEIEE